MKQGHSGCAMGIDYIVGGTRMWWNVDMRQHVECWRGLLGYDKGWGSNSEAVLISHNFVCMP